MPLPPEPVLTVKSKVEPFPLVNVKVFKLTVPLSTASKATEAVSV